MTQLDDCLHGVPRQFTEYQDQESVTFLSYFKTGIIYKVKQDCLTPVKPFLKILPLGTKKDLLLSLYQTIKASLWACKWTRENDLSSRWAVMFMYIGRRTHQCYFGNCLESWLAAPSGFSAEGFRGEFEPTNKPNDEVVPLENRRQLVFT